MLEFVLFLAFGLFVGTYGTLVGAGGGGPSAAPHTR